MLGLWGSPLLCWCPSWAALRADVTDEASSRVGGMPSDRTSGKMRLPSREGGLLLPPWPLDWEREEVLRRAEAEWRCCWYLRCLRLAAANLASRAAAAELRPPAPVVLMPGQGAWLGPCLDLVCGCVGVVGGLACPSPGSGSGARPRIHWWERQGRGLEGPFRGKDQRPRTPLNCVSRGGSGWGRMQASSLRLVLG